MTGVYMGPIRAALGRAGLLALLAGVGCITDPSGEPPAGEEISAAAGDSAGAPGSSTPERGASAERDDGSELVEVSDPEESAPPDPGASLEASILVGDEGVGRVLAVVDGEEITAEDVVTALFLTQTNVVFSAVETAIRRSLVIREARRLGVTVREGDLEIQVEGVLERQDNEFKMAAGPDFEFEDFIRERYGTSPATYREAVRSQVLEELFLSRLVRFDSRQRERMRIRMVIVEDIDLAKEILRKLEAGANFAALARTHSIDRTSESGGLYPPVALDCPNPLLGGLAELPEGTLAEVSTFSEAGFVVYRVARLEERLPADLRDYAEQEAEIRVGLEKSPLDPFEMMEWDRRLRDRYPIEVRLGRS